jgi:hypothetical protein
LLWGTVFGIGVGVTAGVLCGLFSILPTAWSELSATGAASGLLVGAVASVLQLLMASSRGPNALARDWARLGPLPLRGYFLSFRRARRRFLR